MQSNHDRRVQTLSVFAFSLLAGSWLISCIGARDFIEKSYWSRSGINGGEG